MLHRYLHSLVLAAALGLLTGCSTTAEKTDGPDLGRRTAVVIKGRTRQEIMDMTLKVFGEKEYQVKTSGKAEAIFERKGSAMQEATWGGWNTGGGGVWERVTVKISDFDASSQLVEASVKLILDKGDSIFEETRDLPRRQQRPHREILNEVKARLQGPPA